AGEFRPVRAILSQPMLSRIRPSAVLLFPPHRCAGAPGNRSRDGPGRASVPGRSALADALAGSLELGAHTRQAAGIVLLEEPDQLLSHQAAQLPGLSGIARAHQGADL